MQLRIGINIGDVIIDGDDIFGHGVNIAARIERVAEPGGVSLAAVVHDQIVGKVAFQFSEAMEPALKNIDSPVVVYQLDMASVREHQSIVFEQSDTPLPLPDKPSIAVLPFDNMSGDPEQEYFADGITEDIITALSKFRWFFVTARNSTFTYKGSAIDIKEVGRDLGVRYVLEGSVRKAGSNVRITAQLIEAENGNHIWADRYDRKLEDIFELQDEITLTIAAAVGPELVGSERNRALRKPTQALQAWDLFQRGMAKIWRMDDVSMAEAAELMKQALTVDPSMGLAFAYLAVIDYLDVTLSRGESRNATLQQGLTNASRALSIDPRDYVARWALGRLYNLNGDNPSAIRELESCVSINPNFAHGYYGLAAVHSLAGNPEKAIEYADLAIRLNPNDPVMWMVLGHKGLAFIKLGELNAAIKLFEQSCQFPNVQFIPLATLASLYALTGQMDNADIAMKRAKRLEPALDLKHITKYLANADSALRETLCTGFLKANTGD